MDSVVMQFKNNTYYRDHDINQNPSDFGAVFLDYRSDISYIEEARHIVIYGYSKTGGQQLSRLLKYTKSNYFENNSLIILDTDYGTYQFRVFSVHTIDNDEAFTSPKEVNDMPQFIKDCIQNSIFEPSSTPKDYSVILTFSTESNDESEGRLLIHAYLEDDE